MQENHTPVESKSAARKRAVAEFNAKVAPRAKTIDQLTRAEREELKALSKEVFNSTSRWEKLIKNGYPELLTHEVTELVPGKTEADEPTEQKSRVPMKTARGTYMSRMKYHTVDSVRSYMLDRKKQIDDMRAEIKRRQDEARAQREKEQLVQKVHQELQGSAV